MQGQIPPVHYYDVIYEDLVHSLAILMAHDHREHWTPTLTVDADETINNPKLEYLKEHIAALEEEFLRLYQASRELTTTGKQWMIDASKHPAEERGPQRETYNKMHEDHDVPTLENNARDKLSEFRAEIDKQKAVYRAAKRILLQMGCADASASSSNSTSFPDAIVAFGAHTSNNNSQRELGVQHLFRI
ncbi:hypothetical protein AAVH_29956 [Aphelenchoides avenae]|nr:hypothetical protein AAVH_29956 [Aphelenchus avenae]